MTVEVVPITGLPEIRPGGDLSGLVLEAVAEQGVHLEDGDILALTQKVVSKAEGRVVPEAPDGKMSWVRKEARRVVARRGDIVIAETRHGFVCANAGVDASNVAEGFLTLLPEDPDGSAEQIRAALRRATGADVGVVITDTFGRPWRSGVVNVAIGCAGLPALVDLRGTKDGAGRVLEVTVVALADEVAAASGLVMGKADGVPAALVRGVRADAPPLPATALVRPATEDLFRTSPLQGIEARVETTAFDRREVPRALVEEAVAAAMKAATATGVDVVMLEVDSPAARRVVSAAADEKGLAVLASAPVIVLPLLRPPHGVSLGDALMARGGAAVQSLLLAFWGLGLASGWLDAGRFELGELAGLLGGPRDVPLGAVVAGWPLEVS